MSIPHRLPSDVAAPCQIEFTNTAVTTLREAQVWCPLIRILVLAQMLLVSYGLRQADKIMDSKLSKFSDIDEQCAVRGLIRTITMVSVLLLALVVASSVYAESLFNEADNEPVDVHAVGGVHDWEAEDDSELAQMFGQGARISTPEISSELAIILWDEVRNNERRPVRSTADEGNGNIQANRLRMISQ